MFDLEAFAEEYARVPPDKRLAFIKKILAGITDPIEKEEVMAQILIQAELGRAPPPPKQIVVLVHGIRTRAEWQETLRARLAQYPNVRTYPIGYDYFDAFRFWFPALFRKGPVQRVLREIREIRTKHPGEDISVIAHSFGTYIVSKILQQETDIQLRRLLLCGSIIPTRFQWSRVPSKPSEGIVNDVGTSDIWPVLAKCSSWGYGPSGTFGFKTNAVTDRFHALGHSDFFTEQHETRFWIPYLVEGRIVPSEWDANRKTTPWWLSLAAWLPCKSILLLCIIATLWWAFPTVVSKATATISNMGNEYVEEVEVYTSPVQAGWSKGFSDPYTLCTPEKPEGWSIVRVTDFHLISDTDRGTCGRFTTCTGADNDTARRACRTTSVQGHDEPNPWGGWGRIQSVLVVKWKHPK